MDMNIIFVLFLFILGFFIFTLFFTFYFGVGHYVLDHFVDSSFQLNKGRLTELSLSYFLFSFFCGVFIDHVGHHFSVAKGMNSTHYHILLPISIYIVLRFITRFQSSRVSRSHLDLLFFIVLVGLTINSSYLLYRNFSNLSDCYNINTSITFLKNLFPSEFYKENIISNSAIVVLISIFVPLATEITLSFLPKFSFVKKYAVKEKRLIDLTEEMPVTLEFISKKNKIKNKISELINDDFENELRILTNGYTTVKENEISILKRCNIGKRVKIIGSDPNSEQFKEPFANKEKVIKLIQYLESKNLLLCKGGFDGVRVIINGNKDLLASFATGGNKETHIGVYSNHPFVVSLFKDYFDTKCETMNCKLLCKNYSCGQT